MSVIRQRVCEVLVRTLKIDPGLVEDGLAVGDVPAWDSLGHVTVLQALEDEFCLTFDIDDALSIESVRDMVAVITRVTAGDDAQAAR